MCVDFREVPFNGDPKKLAQIVVQTELILMKPELHANMILLDHCKKKVIIDSECLSFISDYKDSLHV